MLALKSYSEPVEVLDDDIGGFEGVGRPCVV